MENKTLKIECKSNPDWEGEWSQKDVEEEILEITGEKAKPGDWIDWIISHDIDSDEVTQAANEVCKIPAFAGLALITSHGLVKITMTR